MTRETRIGIVVASAFVCLLGVVVVSKWRGAAPADAQEHASTADPNNKKVDDAPRTLELLQARHDMKPVSDGDGALKPTPPLPLPSPPSGVPEPDAPNPTLPPPTTVAKADAPGLALPMPPPVAPPSADTGLPAPPPVPRSTDVDPPAPVPPPIEDKKSTDNGISPPASVAPPAPIESTKKPDDPVPPPILPEPKDKLPMVVEKDPPPVPIAAKDPSPLPAPAPIGAKDPMPIANDPPPPIGTTQPAPIGVQPPPLVPAVRDATTPTDPPVRPMPVIPAPEHKPHAPDHVPPIGTPTTDLPMVGGNVPASGRLPEVKSYQVKTIKCQAGDTSFAALSQRLYGSDRYAVALLDYNRGHYLADANIKADPPILTAGQRVVQPPVDVLEAKSAQLMRDNATLGGGPGVSIARPQPILGSNAPAPLPNTRLTSAPTVDSTKSYRVAGQGQMILEIARQTLGDGSRWPEIYRLNPSLQPQFPIPGGTELRLPVQANTP